MPEKQGESVMKKSLLISFLFLCLLVSACAKKQTVAPEENFDQAATELSNEEQFAKEPSIRGVEVEREVALETIYFAFDSSAVSDRFMDTIKNNVKYLKDNPKANVVIEGHCDERGTTEYNLALGQKRAVKVKELYVQLGIKPKRIVTMSYGKEMPADKRHNEAAWAKNRRAETKLIK